MPPTPSHDEILRLQTLVTLGTRFRSPVVRDTWKGDEILRVPAPEGPGRMLTQLTQLVAGMKAIGVPERAVWHLAHKVALDGMHPLRSQVLDVVMASPHELTTSEVAARCALPRTSVRRHLQDLAAHGVLNQTDDVLEIWMVSDWTWDQWAGGGRR
jgi:hypothetical protein